MAITKFPLENLERYKGQIRFRPFINRPPDITGKIGIAGVEAANSSDLGGGGGGPSFETTGRGGSNNPIISASQEIPTYEEIVLYMPPTVQIMDGVNIQNIDLGSLGAGVEAGIRAGSGPIESIISNTGNQISSFLDALTGNIDAEGARVVASRTAAMFGTDGIPGAIQSAVAVVPNPNTRMIFRSVNIREFAFDFRMIPTSQAETEAIKAIIHSFRKNLYPKTIELEGTGIPVAYRFPNIFKIDMWYNGKNLSDSNPDLRFQNMYLRQFTANYNPNNMGFYKSGDFNEVQITLAFTETKALTFDDVSSEEEQYSNWLIDTYGRDAFRSRGFR